MTPPTSPTESWCCTKRDAIWFTVDAVRQWPPGASVCVEFCCFVSIYGQYRDDEAAREGARAQGFDRLEVALDALGHTTARVDRSGYLYLRAHQ